MGGTKQYEGVRPRSDKGIEIDFRYRGERCRETFKLAPTAANLKRVSQHRAAILDAIAHGTFDYAVTFPESNSRHKFAENPKASGMLVEDYLDNWITTKQKQLKSSTFAGYKKVVTMLNKTDIGRVELTELRRAHVKAWCVKQECSNKWLANVQSVLRSALQDALDDDLLEVNPLYGWKYENAEALRTKDDVDPFLPEEREAILNACRDAQHRNMFEFAFWTGLRTSELVALTWGDIDWLRGEARINKARTQESTEAETTKTRKGIRDVKLLAPAMAALKRQKEITFLQGGEIFRDPRTGDPWSGDEPIRQGPWKTALKRAGVRYRRPYQTRHTYASMMLTAGEPLAWVAQQMGHADLSMIARIYGRWIKSAMPDVGGKAVEMFYQSCDQNCDQAMPNVTISGPQAKKSAA